MRQVIKRSSLVVPAGMCLVGMADMAPAHDEHRMLLTGKGHGVLFCGEARKQAGVPEEIADHVWGMQDQLSSWRHDLHKIPELGNKESETHAYLMKTLTGMGYKPQKIGPSTGIMVDITGADQSFTIGLRADMDGLPITEVNDGRPYRSTK